MQYIHTFYVLSIPNGLSPMNHKGVEAFLQLFSNSKDNLLPPIIKESSPIWAARICRPTLWNILNQKFQAKMQERRGWLMDSSDWSQRWHLSGWGIPFLAGRSAVQHLQWGGLAACSYRHSYLVPFFEWPIGISYRGCTPSGLIIGLRPYCYCFRRSIGEDYWINHPNPRGCHFGHWYGHRYTTSITS